MRGSYNLNKRMADLAKAERQATAKVMTSDIDQWLESDGPIESGSAALDRLSLWLAKCGWERRS